MELHGGTNTFSNPRNLPELATLRNFFRLSITKIFDDFHTKHPTTKKGIIWGKIMSDLLAFGRAIIFIFSELIALKG